MTPAQKLHLVERLWFDARKLKAAGLRAQHPDWSEEKIEEKLRDIFLNAKT